MVPGFVVASIGGNWRSDSPPKDGKSNKSANEQGGQQQQQQEAAVDTVTLYKDGKITFHPETKDDDDLLRRLKSGASSTIKIPPMAFSEGKCKYL